MSKPVRESLDFGGGPQKPINVPAGVAGGDVATMAQLNALPSGLVFIERPVRVASTATVAVASPGASIDGVALSNGDRVLLWKQTTASENGTYNFNGSASPLTRTTDTFMTGSVVFAASDGTTNKNIGFILTTDSPIIGSTSLTFVDAFKVFSPGTGLTLTGNVFSLTAPVAVSLGGTNATTGPAALTSLGAARPYEADFGNGSASSFSSFTPTTLAKYPVVQVTNNSTGAVEDASVSIVPGSLSGGVYTPTVTITAESWVSAPPGSNAYHVTIVG